MPTKKYSFYIDGNLDYICYTNRLKNNYESDLIRRCVNYELKIEEIGF